MADTEHTSQELSQSVAETRRAEEYEAGYKARLEGVPECLAATLCWQAGWHEADSDTESAVTAIVDTMHTNAEVRTPWSLFGTGREARVCNLPFDELCPDSWKRSWVEADIDVGLSQRRVTA